MSWLGTPTLTPKNLEKKSNFRIHLKNLKMALVISALGGAGPAEGPRKYMFEFILIEIEDMFGFGVG